VRSFRGVNKAIGRAATVVAVLIIQKASGYQIIQ
jgi:hypothetical protein